MELKLPQGNYFLRQRLFGIWQQTAKLTPAKKFKVKNQTTTHRDN